MKSSLRLLFLDLALLCVSCTATNPATRAQRRAAAFQTLPAEHQRMALDGKIKEGMGHDAVWVAWGPATQICEASQQGIAAEIWNYTGLQPVYGSGLSLGFGYGFGGGRRCDRYSHAEPFPFYDYHYGPQYVPYTQAEVKFQHGVVKSWQRLHE